MKDLWDDEWDWLRELLAGLMDWLKLDKLFEALLDWSMKAA